MKKRLLGFALVSVFAASLTSAQTPANSSTVLTSHSSSFSGNLPFRDPSLPIAERVDDLVSRMTLQEKVEQMMQAAPAIPRLGVPAYNWWSEGLHGVANTGYATVFPQAIGMAASFDPDLLHIEAGVKLLSFAPNTTKNCGRTATAAGFTASLYGRRTSIFFVIRAGGAARKPTAKIPS